MSKSRGDSLSKRNIFAFSIKYLMRFIMWSFFVRKTNLRNKWVLLIWPKINWEPKKETAETKSPFLGQGVGGRGFSFSHLLLWCVANYQLLSAEQLKTRVQVGKEAESVLKRFSTHAHDVDSITCTLVKVEPYKRENYNYSWCCLSLVESQVDVSDGLFISA